MSNGWDESAQAWITDMGDKGDFGRRYVLDPVMQERALRTGARAALDIGCGEGRFCRMLNGHGIQTTGLDPTRALIEHARTRDPAGTYVEASAEELPFDANSFDLVVSYLSLIDIPDIRRAIPEMARVIRPGGQLLIANLNNFNTAGQAIGWQKSLLGTYRHFGMDDYLTERADWIEWRGIRIQNYHRPFQVYMQLFLGEGLHLTHYSEPAPTSDARPIEKAARYRRVPWFCVMEWQKPTT